jgi:cardiolipin synthase A/B
MWCNLPHKRAALLGSITLLGCLGLTACATVPVVDENAAQPSSRVHMVGSRGPLTQRQAKAVLSRLAAQAPNAGALERHLAIEQAVAESALFTGNQVQILRDGDQTFPAMFAAIHSAQRFLLLEYYIFEDVSCNGEQLGDLLVAKARAGVRIHVIYDGIGSIDTPADFFDRLKGAGVQMVEFNPPNPLKGGRRFSINDRDHRKMLIADGDLVMVGGVNLSKTYQSAPGSGPSGRGGQGSSGQGSSRKGADGEGAKDPAMQPPDVWHDTDLQIRGPVVVELQKLFRQHWQEQQGGPLVIDADHPPPAGNEVVRIIGSQPKQLTSRYYVTLLTAIHNAESSIWVTSAYFVPTHQEKEGLIHAARAGIDVRLLLPSHSDSSPALQVQHSHYSDLLAAGVKIYERNSGILHSKAVVVDGVWSITGSSNFDHRSILFNDEVDAVVLGKETGEQLRTLFQSDLEDARGIDLQEWRKRGVLTKLREQFWRLWEKLL